MDDRLSMTNGLSAATPTTALAIVGAGRMGARHARASSALRGARLAWVVDPDLPRAELLAAEHGARASADLDDALGSGDVDAVIVATPTPTHRQIAERAAGAGKHVLCEKPIARSVEDGWAVVDACARADVRLMVGHVLRFSSAYAALDALIREGAVGSVQSVRMFRATNDPRRRQPWYADFDASGGPILDLMIHDVDVLRWYFGDVGRVVARGIGGSSDQLMDGASAEVQLGGGLVAHLETSWLHGEFAASTKIVGSSGTLAYDSEQATVALSSGSTGPAFADVRPHADARREDLYQVQLGHFLTRLADGRSFVTSGEEAVRTLEVALAAIESARTHRPVPASGTSGLRASRPSP